MWHSANFIHVLEGMFVELRALPVALVKLRSHVLH